MQAFDFCCCPLTSIYLFPGNIWYLQCRGDKVQPFSVNFRVSTSNLDAGCKGCTVFVLKGPKLIGQSNQNRRQLQAVSLLHQYLMGLIV